VDLLVARFSGQRLGLLYGLLGFLGEFVEANHVGLPPSQ
jgi:hypothetical protein